jgi:hypothetical protein
MRFQNIHASAASITGNARSSSSAGDTQWYSAPAARYTPHSNPTAVAPMAGGKKRINSRRLATATICTTATTTAIRTRTAPPRNAAIPCSVMKFCLPDFRLAPKA